jgi:hypothetical protein
MKDVIAAVAGHFTGDTLKMKMGLCGQGVLGNDLPVKLHGIIDNGGKLADHQVDLLNLSVLGVLEDNIKDALGD